ncbi:hypothetical protein J1N35_045844 [Gossypium stocksii]|uniref:Uncharacterized protein n=1 Tax=Gossypium stocksii TaxID=47602 RepID=A0A9D3UC17_9ROSI|nr:hypothetical protein J1N35_045844 [Gossypium stocksii]
MAQQFIHLDNKHISVDKMQMAGGASWIQNSSVHLWRGGDPRCAYSIFHARSVPSLWRTYNYISGYWWMNPYLPGPRVILNNIYGGRINMGWLRETFLMPRDDSTEVQRVRYARVYIFQIIRGYLMLDKS